MKVTIQNERNVAAREGVEHIAKNYGIKFSFMAKQLNMSISSFSQWKHSSYQFGNDRLEQVEHLISKYK